MAAKIKKGDTVVVLTGRDKGKTGKCPDPAVKKALVRGVTRSPPPKQTQSEAGIIAKEAAIHLSNIALADPRTENPRRFQVQEDGTGPRGQAFGRPDRWLRPTTPRLKTHYQVVAQAAGQVRLQEPDAGSGAREDRSEHWRCAVANSKGRIRKKISDRRPEAGHHEGKKSIATFKVREMPLGGALRRRRC